ncbi:putative signal transducing protein [Bacteroidota bacterium]
MSSEDKLEPDEYFCDLCNTKVNFEDTVCSNCGAQFDNIVDEKNDNIIILKTYMSEVDAQLAVEYLKSNNIEAFISKDDAGSMYIMLQQASGVRVMIHESEAKKALKILKGMEKEEEKEAGENNGVSIYDSKAGDKLWRCPKCGEESEIQFVICWNCGSERD